MKRKAVGMLFISQCKKCNRVIYHSEMKDGIHISNINFCPFCGHKLNKETELNDLTEA